MTEYLTEMVQMPKWFYYLFCIGYGLFILFIWEAFIRPRKK